MGYVYISPLVKLVWAMHNRVLINPKKSKIFMNHQKRQTMYDRIKIRLNADKLPKKYDWHAVLAGVDNGCILTEGNGGYGYWRGGKVSVKEDSVMFDGSLPKCLYGHNIYSVRLSDVKSLIMKLSKDLGLPMYDADVIYVEFAHNFAVSQPPVKYLNMLIGIPKLKNNGWDSSRYFDKCGVRVKFYDKVAEVKKKKKLPKCMTIPPYLLRYELTFHSKRLKEIFKDGLTARDLWNKKSFWIIVSEWLWYYEQIDTRPGNCMDIDFSAFDGIKDFQKWTVCMLNDSMNLSSFVKDTLFRYRSNRRTKDRSRHRQIQNFIAESMEWIEGHLPPNELMKELSDCMSNYLEFLEKSRDGLTSAEYQSMLTEPA